MRSRLLNVLTALLFLLPLSAQAAPSIVQAVALTSGSGSITITNSGDTLICLLAGNGANSGSLTSIAYDGSTTAFTTDDGFRLVADGADGKDYYTGSWSIASVTSGSHSVALTMVNVTNARVYLIEVSGLGSFDLAATGKYGNSASPVSNSITPTVSGDLLLAGYVALSGGITYSGLGSFTSQATQTTSPSNMLASYVQPTAGAITSGATMSASTFWMDYLVAYKAAGAGGTCTHAGITSAGAFAVPVAGTTVMRLKNGSFGTVDCSTVSYFQERGVFGVN